jgi:phosphopantetheinyl transferase (holo-ACP synthase)
MPAANASMRVYAQIETRRGLDNADAILAVEGVDGIFIGPNDLSVDLNCGKEEICRCMELAAQAANASVAIIRFWCAKEAVSKALGTGIRYSPKELVVSEYQADTGKLIIRLKGAWEEAFKNFKGRDLLVNVATVRDHALATSFIPASLFSDAAV